MSAAPPRPPSPTPRDASSDRPPDRDDLRRALELTPRYDRPGPRYTSYPPAPHFSDAVGPDAAREALGARGPGAPPLSVYVHLPFCESMCTFCGCNVILARDHGIADRYLSGLERDVALVARALAGGPREVVQVHLGGGTPTWFSPAELERLHAALATHFDVAPGAEMAVEVDPRVTTREHLRALADLGWRRVSMGVQDFDARVQTAVNRVQGADATTDLVRAAREEGFTSVNVDLMYGLPHQTLDGFRTTLEEVLARLAPDRVSLFGYAHVPWLKAHQRRIDEAALPAPAARLALFHAGVEAFVGAGYDFIGLDHFARPGDDLARARATGDLHRNFMGFHTAARTDMVAFGVTAIADVQGTYLQNHHGLVAWERDLAAGRLPVERGYRRTPDDHVRGAIVQDLMCNGRVTRAVLEAGGGPWRARFPEAATALAAMQADGLLHADDEGVTLTPLGRLFVRNACMAFDAHLGHAPARAKPGAPRYSRTV